jgi:hypothetical protein
MILRSRIAQLTSDARFLRGTLSDRSSKCGQPNCHCANGQGHGSVYLVERHAGKIRQTCVPKTSQDLVRQAAAGYREIQRLMAKKKG